MKIHVSYKKPKTLRAHTRQRRKNKSLNSRSRLLWISELVHSCVLAKLMDEKPIHHLSRVRANPRKASTPQPQVRPLTMSDTPTLISE